MPVLEEVVLAYVAAWNEPDAARRRELVDACWSEQGAVLGPDTHYAGRGALLDDIARFHRERPGWRGYVTSGLDAHHCVVRFAVAIEDAAGNVVTHGIDVGELDGDGRITRILTFWGDLPAIPDAWPSTLAHAVPR